jgi:hypothetical protein
VEAIDSMATDFGTGRCATALMFGTVGMGDVLGASYTAALVMLAIPTQSRPSAAEPLAPCP